MNNTTAVDVFLGHPLVDDTEQHFLERLRRDLALRGTPALVLANIVAPPKYRQIDFLIVTAQRTILCELKGYTVPTIGRSNGRWQRIVGGVAVDTDGNAFRQAQDQVYGLSDTMRRYAQVAGAPAPRKRSYYQDIDTVVCCYPSIPNGSRFERFPFVSVLGYEDLLDRLHQPGPSSTWPQADWDGFIRHIGLYRDERDDAAVQALRAHRAVVEEYRGRLAQSLGATLPPAVPTSVAVDGQRADRPDLTRLLTDGRHVVLRAGTGAGKSLWARVTALELAQAGHVPIWLHASACDERFSTSLARAVAPYTTQTPGQLLTAAEAAGRGVVVVLDGLNEAHEQIRASLWAGARALALRGAARAILATDQARPQDAGDMVDVELLAPDGQERLAVLRAHGAEHLDSAAVEAFTTPFELSLAAACAEQLADADRTALLLDAYVHRTAENETTRAALREIAWRMHDQVRLSLPAPDALRLLQREMALDAQTAERVLTCRLLTTTQARVRFTHERFASFLAAERALITNDDATVLSRLLNQPQHLGLRRDVIALELDEDRLGVLLSELADAGGLTAAARGELGDAAARVGRAVIGDALRIACARTTTESARFELGAIGGFDDAWVMEHAMTAVQRAQLSAGGVCLRHGLFVEEIGALLDATDARCATIAQEHPDGGIPDRLVAATYAVGRPNDAAGFPASLLVQACIHARHTSAAGPATETAVKLLARHEHPGPGTLMLAANLLKPVTGEGARYVAQIVAACLSHGAYHLRLEGLQLVELAAAQLQPEEHQVVVEAVRAVETNNILLNSVVVEALSALGDISPIRDLNDIAEEIDDVLSRPDDSLTWQRARGIVSSQFEDDVIGPYYEAVTQLSTAQRTLLLALALRASDPDDLTVCWIVDELDDLGEPQVVTAVLDLLARADPSAWNSTQMAMGAILSILALLAGSDHDLPALASQDEGWHAFLTLILTSLRHAHGRATSDDVDAAWRTVLAEREVLPDLLAELHHARVLGSNRTNSVEATLLAARPGEIAETLTWALDHPDALRSPFRWSHGRTPTLIELLGHVGDHQAATVLRRFVNDPELSACALAAIRDIEARATP